MWGRGMAVVALSGALIYVALKAHQHLVADFEDHFRRELGQKKRRSRIKRVRFADDVLQPSSDNRAYRKRRPKMTSSRLRAISEEEHEGVKRGNVPPDMPLNRVALYRGIREDRIKRGLLH